MKTFLAKAILLLTMVGGLSLALFLYNHVLALLSRLIDVVGYNWISIVMLFVVGILVAGLDIRMLAKDFRTTNAINELSVPKVLKFFVGGFVGCYAGFSVMGVFALITSILLRTFFNLG